MKTWSGFQLRITVVPVHIGVVQYAEFGPFYLLVPQADGTTQLQGTLGSMLTSVTAALNMTYSLVAPLDGEYGMVEEETGRLTGMLDTVLQNKADVAAGPFPVHPLMHERLHDMTRSQDSFTAFSIISGMKNDYIKAPTSFTNAFDNETWILLGLSLISVVAVLVAFRALTGAGGSKTLFDTLTKWLFNSFAVFLQEATSEAPSKIWFERSMILMWLTSCMLLSYSFAGSMRASLVVVQPTFRFKTLNDVLRRPDMTIVYPANTPAENMIDVTAADPVYGEPLRRRIAQNSFATTLSALKEDWLRDRLAKQTAIVFMEEKYLKSKCIARWCVNSKYHFFVSKLFDMFLGVFSSRALPEALNRDLDMQILWLQAYAVPFMKENQLLDGHLGCIAETEKKTADSTKQLTPGDLIGIWVTLALGLLVSGLGFTIEMLYYGIENSRTPKFIRKNKAFKEYSGIRPRVQAGFKLVYGSGNNLPHVTIPA